MGRGWKSSFEFLSAVLKTKRKHKKNASPKKLLRLAVIIASLTHCSISYFHLGCISKTSRKPVSLTRRSLARGNGDPEDILSKSQSVLEQRFSLTLPPTPLPPLMVFNIILRFHVYNQSINQSINLYLTRKSYHKNCLPRSPVEKFILYTKRAHSIYRKIQFGSKSF